MNCPYCGESKPCNCPGNLKWGSGKGEIVGKTRSGV